MKLHEGDVERFWVRGLRSLPDGQPCYLLDGPDGFSTLLPEKYYRNYGIETGRPMECKISRINCNGKVFLEPMHPVYSIGMSYEFNILERQLFSDNECEFTAIAIKDSSSDIHLVVMPGKFENEYISCRVHSIRKGQIKLVTDSSDVHRDASDDHGLILPFRCAGVFRISETEAYHVFHYQKLRFAFLSFRYFLPNQFKPGSLTDMMACYSKRNQGIQLEPIHPMYQPSMVYPFRYDSIVEDHDILRGFKRFIRVKDAEENFYNVPVMGLKYKGFTPGQSVYCRVRSYRNGKPIFEIDQLLISKSFQGK